MFCDAQQDHDDPWLKFRGAIIIDKDKIKNYNKNKNKTIIDFLTSSKSLKKYITKNSLTKKDNSRKKKYKKSKKIPNSFI